MLGTHFEHMPQMLTYRQISSKFYFAYNVSYKKKTSVKHRLIGSFFWSLADKRQGYKDLHNPNMNKIK